MARVFSTQEIKDFEADLMGRLGLSAFDLMESVAAQMATALEKILTKYPRSFDALSVLVGPGANGGDAISALRHLLENAKSAGISVPPVELYFFDTLGDLGQKQKNLFEEAFGKRFSFRFSDFSERFAVKKSKKTLLIDGVFGTGLKSERKLEFVNQRTIDAIQKNRSQFFIIGVDLPSGLLENGSMLAGFERWSVDLSLCVSGPKWSQLMSEGVEASGKLVTVPLIEEPNLTALPQFLTSKRDVFHLQKLWQVEVVKRSPSAHKNSLPPVLVLGGNLERGGAAKFSSEALLRLGAGSVFLQEIPSSKTKGRFYLQGAREWLSLNSSETRALLKKNAFQTIVFGPGLPAFSNPDRKKVSKEVSAILSQIRKFFRGTLIVDGGGLSFWAEDLKKNGKAPYSVVLTPHPKEAMDMLSVLGHKNRLVNKMSLATKECEIRDVNARLSRRDLFAELSRTLSEKFHDSSDSTVLLLKGAYPVCGLVRAESTSQKRLEIAEQFVFNLADARLATQGSGDVLTGLIAGLIQRMKLSSHRNIAAVCTAVMIQKYALKQAVGLPVMIARRQLRVFPLIAEQWLYELGES